MLTEEMILRMAKAYAIYAIRESSDYSRSYWKNVLYELTRIQRENLLEIKKEGD